MKKIAIFLPHIGSGGLTRILLVLADALSAQKHHVNLIILDQPIPENLQSRVPKNVTITRLKSKRTITSILPLKKHLSNYPPDILLSGGPSANCIATISRLLVKKEIKLIITEHSLPSVDVFDSGKKVDRALPYLMKFLYPKADRIVAVSNAVANDLSQFISIDKDKIDIIYNPIVDANLLNKGNTPIEHKWLKDQKENVVLFVGRLEKVKNLPLLIDAFNIAHEKQQNIKLLIVGDGSERENLEKYIHELNLQNSIDFIGYTSNPYPYIRKADILILTSLWEGLPTVLIEAMAFGTNIIATNNLEGAGEILLNGEIGYFVENDPHAIATALIKGIQTPPNTDLLINRANDFSIQKSIKKYLNLF